MKKILSLLVAMFLLTTCVFAESAENEIDTETDDTPYTEEKVENEEPSSTGYDVIYTSANPIPEIAKRVRPAVVVIHCTTTTWSQETGLTTTLETSSGSGVYIDERGYIVTNNHVVEDADDVEVEWLDGTRMVAEIVGQDDGYDVALLKVEGPIENAEPVKIGDSDTIEIGELAIVIGNPASGENILFGTVTAGIISGLQRNEVNAGNFGRALNVIQTDAAINTGNSGGALLNAKGELIGIPTLKYLLSQTTIYESLGFAIPINSILPFINSTIETGKFSRPRMGIDVFENIGPEEALKHNPPMGLVINMIEPDSPATEANLQLNDVITHINGIRVHNYIEMTAIVDLYSAGDVITLTISRYYDENGEQLPRPVTIEAELTLDLEE